MKNKKLSIIILITCLIGGLLFITNKKNSLYLKAKTFYQVYLNGNNIGTIDNEKELYALIDNNQSAIKQKYDVDSVYPPTDLKVMRVLSYNMKSDNITSVYEKIEENDNFTVLGYKVTITSDDKNYTINVLDKDIFYNAAKRFVKAFLDEFEYENYIKREQDEIKDIGRLIENMYFKEDITIRESYINVNEKIYTDESELTQYLLFGNNPEEKVYTVKLGDTIDSISEANQLNSEEFLIANPKFKTANTLLRVGDNVNVTLIEPQLTFIYDLYEISDEIVYYEKKTVYDKNKPNTYKETTQVGQDGKNRITEKYSVTNGEREQGVDPISVVSIREKVDQVTTIGTKYEGTSNGGTPVITDGDWGWPTNSGYVITSYYGWRWGRMHNGIDISGAGNFGSAIRAAADGTVVYVYNGCPSKGRGYGDSCGGEMGNSVIIDHGNGYYTTYAHLHQTILVSVGSTVKKGDRIGSMGNSGSSTGSHLHFAVSKGSPTSGYMNPISLYR